MTIARVIRKGSRQSLDLPSDVRLYNEEVEVVRRGDELVVKDPVSPPPGAETNWERVFDLLADLGELIDEFPADPPPEDRPGLWSICSTPTSASTCGAAIPPGRASCRGGARASYR